MLFEPAELTDAAREVAERLSARGQAARIWVVGSTAVAKTASPDRASTGDLDVFLDRHAAVVLEVAAEVARERGWREDWLNSKAQVFDPASGELPEWVEHHRAGDVEIFVAPPELLLAMKLLAGRGRRDDVDIAPLVAACAVTSMEEAEAIFDRFYPHDEIKPLARAELLRIFSE